MSVVLKGAITGNEAEVDDYKALLVTMKDSSGNTLSHKQREAIASTQEALIMAGKNDGIAVMQRVDRKGNTLMGNYIPELLENFEGATVNVQKWTPTSTTFVPAQTTLGGYIVNNTGLTTASAVSNLTSQRLFYKLPRVPLQMKQRVRANIFTNSFADWGFGVPSGTTLIVPNGVAVRVVNGLWSVVITYNSVEIASENIVGVDGSTQLSTANSNAEFYVVDLILDDDNVVVTVQNTLSGVMVGQASLEVPLSAAKMFGATALPVYNRLANSGTPSTAPNLTISELQVISMDWRLTPDMSQIAGSLGLSAGRNPFTGAALENHTNSTAPTSATLSNTAAGYSTLGGRFQFAAVAGAGTDFALFAIAVPAGSRFLCEGIHIETYNTGAAVATTASVLEWAMGFNSSAVSLATANIIRRQVGVQSFAVGAGIGAVANPIDVQFTTPEVVESGRFLHVILNLPIGTATASQVIRGVVTVRGRFI
jgi:hypothetical protein